MDGLDRLGMTEEKINKLEDRDEAIFENADHKDRDWKKWEVKEKWKDEV